MKPAALALVGLSAVAAFALLNRQANTQAADAAASDAGDGTTALDWVDPFGSVERRIDQFQTDQAMQDTNVDAFIAAIIYAEGTARGGRDPYRTCYGYRHTIESFADHPAVTGEWRGEPLDNLGPAYVGKVSTAAGALQIKRDTWLECKRALSLPDFSPDSQRRAGVFLIKRAGALDDVRAGRFDGAVSKCRGTWASLPGAGYGQPERQLATLRDAFAGAGGVFA